jgi:hydroxymethylpyrimidine pyrophosphatase-like HAD family hydrolase
MVIAVDFDGTIVEHRYPSIGKELPFAIETLLKLKEDGHRLILWTVREGKYLDEAIAFCRERGLEFYAINRDYPEEEQERNNHFTRKLKADLWIDDRNLGGLPDWGTIYEMIHHRLTYEDLMHHYENEERDNTANKGFFQQLFKKRYK